MKAIIQVANYSDIRPNIPCFTEPQARPRPVGVRSDYSAVIGPNIPVTEVIGRRPSAVATGVGISVNSGGSAARGATTSPGSTSRPAEPLVTEVLR